MEEIRIPNNIYFATVDTMENCAEDGAENDAEAIDQADTDSFSNNEDADEKINAEKSMADTEIVVEEKLSKTIDLDSSDNSNETDSTPEVNL